MLQAAGAVEDVDIWLLLVGMRLARLDIVIFWMTAAGCDLLIVL